MSNFGSELQERFLTLNFALYPRQLSSLLPLHSFLCAEGGYLHSTRPVHQESHQVQLQGRLIRNAGGRADSQADRALA